MSTRGRSGPTADTPVLADPAGLAEPAGPTDPAGLAEPAGPADPAGLADPAARRIWRVACRPSMTAVPTSTRMTPGASCRARLTASAPSAACPTTTRSGWAASTAAKPSLTIAWSSTIRHLVLIASGRHVEGKHGGHHESAVGRRTGRQGAAQQRDPLAHSGQPVAATHSVRRRLPG